MTVYDEKALRKLEKNRRKKARKKANRKKRQGWMNPHEREVLRQILADVEMFE